MDFLPPKIEEYAERFSSPETELLTELNRYTHTNVLQPRMLAGHLQGRVLAMISHMIQPKSVLEIGTYTGYSALCWAEGLQSGGMVHTIDKNDELESKINAFLERSVYKDQVSVYIGEALPIIQTMDETFDIVYIDADKENYSHYYDAVIDKVPIGGYIIADNVLWSGKVLDSPKTMDFETKCLYNYAEPIKQDSRVEQVLLPIRDGLLIARKI
ncbi:MAG: O-methyltransferase [Salibacteraceae bacterium]